MFLYFLLFNIREILIYSVVALDNIKNICYINKLAVAIGRSSGRLPPIYTSTTSFI